MDSKINYKFFIFLFAVEGFMLQFTSSINGFGNNLYATNLGATDSQIGLIQTVPNLAAILFLLPLGVLSDRISSSKRVPLMTLISMATGFVIMASTPLFSNNRMLVFYFALALTVGSTAIYNSQWQNFFGNCVHMKDQTQVLTRRNQAMFFIGIIAPVLCGMMMRYQTTVSGKLSVLQLFFIICAIACVFQIIAVALTPESPELSKRAIESSYSVIDSIKLTFSKKSFVMFFIPVIFFYMTWQIDWSMWYIGQVDYIGFNEAELSIYNGVFNIGQLFAVGILSRVVYKKGADFAVILAPLGLMFCPLTMIISSILPAPIRVASFTILVTVLDATQCVVNLCIVQIILQVTVKEVRNIAISLYTITITLTNSIMPYLGIKIYEALGSDYKALIQFNFLVFMLRIISILLFLYRYKVVSRKEVENTD